MPQRVQESVLLEDSDGMKHSIGSLKRSSLWFQQLTGVPCELSKEVFDLDSNTEDAPCESTGGATQDLVREGLHVDSCRRFNHDDELSGGVFQ
jgi:hypothetical protein